jgi:hypothetical protein
MANNVCGIADHSDFQNTWQVLAGRHFMSYSERTE